MLEEQPPRPGPKKRLKKGEIYSRPPITISQKAKEKSSASGSEPKLTGHIEDKKVPSRDIKKRALGGSSELRHQHESDIPHWLENVSSPKLAKHITETQTPSVGNKKPKLEESLGVKEPFIVPEPREGVAGFYKPQGEIQETIKPKNAKTEVKKMRPSNIQKLQGSSFLGQAENPDFERKSSVRTETPEEEMARLQAELEADEKLRTKTFSSDVVGKKIKTLMETGGKGLDLNFKVESMKVEGIQRKHGGEAIKLTAKIKINDVSSPDLWLDLFNYEDSISYNGNYLDRLSLLVRKLKTDLEKEEGRKVEKMKIENKELKVVFE